MSDLGPLGGDRFVNTNYWGYSSYGYAINKFGQVAGVSQNKESWNHAFFIDPKWPTPGLLAFYPFSGNAQDVSGHAYHGQVFGATLTPGYQGQAYSFNGTDQNPHYIKAPLDISPSQHWNVTLGAWVKAAADFRDSIVVGSAGYFNRGIGISGWPFSPSWSAYFGEDDGHVLMGDPVVPGTWVFLAASYDQTAQTLKFYVNDKVYTKTVWSLSMWDGDPYLGIGAYLETSTSAPDVVNSFFIGTIDNVFVYHGVLSDAQIAAIRGNGVLPRGRITSILELLLLY